MPCFNVVFCIDILCVCDGLKRSAVTFTDIWVTLGLVVDSVCTRFKPRAVTCTDVLRYVLMARSMLGLSRGL